MKKAGQCSNWSKSFASEVVDDAKTVDFTIANYSAAQRNRNQLNILLATIAWIILILGFALINDVNVGWIAGRIGLVIAFSVASWWLFASNGAKPLPDKGRFMMRWLVSKKWEDKYGKKS